MTLAGGLFGALAFGILIDEVDRYVSREAALAFVLLAMFLAAAPLNALRPSGHVMGLLGAAILLRWILKYRDIRSLPVRAGTDRGVPARHRVPAPRRHNRSAHRHHHTGPRRAQCSDHAAGVCLGDVLDPLRQPPGGHRDGTVRPGVVRGVLVVDAVGVTTAIFVVARMRAWSPGARRLMPAAALAYDGQSFVHGVATARPDATVLATRAEAGWLTRHHDTTSWGYYWDVYMLDLMGFPHLAYAANTNLNIPRVAREAAGYCRDQGTCPVILDAPPTSAVFQETPTAFSAASLGTLQYVSLLQHAHGYYVYEAASVPKSSA